MALIRDAARNPLTRFVALMLGGYVAVACITNAPDMLIVGNALMASAAIAIMVAYARPAGLALVAPRATRGGLLALGIFLSWTGVALLRLLVLAVYGFDMPFLFGTDYSTLAMHLQFMAALMHLAAPDLADDGAIAARTWLTAAGLVGGGMLLLCAVVLLRPYV